MTKPDLTINNYSKHLFWDTDRIGLNTETNKDYIIKQVLEYGLIKDWQQLQQTYGIDKIAKSAKTYR